MFTALGLGCYQNFFAFPLIIMGFWKCGFPETYMYMYSAIFARKHEVRTRIADLCNGVGLAIHHAAVAWAVSFCLVGLIPVTRITVAIPMVVIMQHWFALLRIVNLWLFIFVVLVLEFFFEWTIISEFEYLCVTHWALALGAAELLLSHWFFLLAGTLDFLFPAAVATLLSSPVDASDHGRLAQTPKRTAHDQEEASSSSGSIMMHKGACNPVFHVDLADNDAEETGSLLLGNYVANDI